MTPSTTTAAGSGRERTAVAPVAAATGPRTLWLLAAVVVLLIVCAVSLAVGARGLSLVTVWQALTEFNPDDGGHAVVHARIPRTVLGLLAGGALGLAGAAMQGVT